MPTVTVLCACNFASMNVRKELFYMHKNECMQILNLLSPVSCTNTHCDVTDLVNYGMVKNTKTWIFWEQNILFLWNKKILNLCLRWHILRSYCFAVKVNFNNRFFLNRFSLYFNLFVLLFVLLSLAWSESQLHGYYKCYMETELRLGQCFLNKAKIFVHWNTIAATFSCVQYLTKLENSFEYWLGKNLSHSVYRH